MFVLSYMSGLREEPWTDRARQSQSSFCKKYLFLCLCNSNSTFFALCTALTSAVNKLSVRAPWNGLSTTTWLSRKRGCTRPSSQIPPKHWRTNSFMILPALPYQLIWSKFWPNQLPTRKLGPWCQNGTAQFQSFLRAQRRNWFWRSCPTCRSIGCNCGPSQKKDSWSICSSSSSSSDLSSLGLKAPATAKGWWKKLWNIGARTSWISIHHRRGLRMFRKPSSALSQHSSGTFMGSTCLSQRMPMKKHTFSTSWAKRRQQSLRPCKWTIHGPLKKTGQITRLCW